jgi:hypothetical protein
MLLEVTSAWKQQQDITLLPTNARILTAAFMRYFNNQSGEPQGSSMPCCSMAAAIRQQGCGHMPQTKLQRESDLLLRNMTMPQHPAESVACD